MRSWPMCTGASSRVYPARTRGVKLAMSAVSRVMTGVVNIMLSARDQATSFRPPGPPFSSSFCANIQRASRVIKAPPLKPPVFSPSLSPPRSVPFVASPPSLSRLLVVFNKEARDVETISSELPRLVSRLRSIARGGGAPENGRRLSIFMDGC